MKETLIQFKKMKPREFEFGYRIAVDGETVYSVEKSMKEEVIIKKSMSPSMARVDVCGIISGVQEVSQSSAGNAEQPLLISLKPILQEISSDVDMVTTEDSRESSPRPVDERERRSRSRRSRQRSDTSTPPSARDPFIDPDDQLN